MHEKKIMTYDELMTAMDKLHGNIRELNMSVSGIGESNGQFAETYFYNTLTNSMKFGGKNFDEIDRGLKRTKKLHDGKKIEGEYDVIMYNGDTIALIEIKYRVRKTDVDELRDKKIQKFKLFFPQYSDYGFFLGIGGMSFDHGAEEAALQDGIGILRPKGEAVEIIDDNLKTY